MPAEWLQLDRPGTERDKQHEEDADRGRHPEDRP
jgi:hypothetical protein